MSETKGRKVHQPEFKAKVGLEAIRGVKTVNEIGQEFGVHPTLENQWKPNTEEASALLWVSYLIHQVPHHTMEFADSATVQCDCTVVANPLEE